MKRGFLLAILLSSVGCLDVVDDEDLAETEDAATLSAALRVGLTGNDAFGIGPEYSGGEWTRTNPYNVTIGHFSPTELADMLPVAQQKGILIVLNMAGNRNLWTNERIVDNRRCLMYDVEKFRARIRAFDNVPGLRTALAERRVIVYVVDEPNIDDFCNSISPTEANAMGLYVKSRFNGAITMLRSSASVMRNGFAGQGPLGDSFWTGIDYGYGLYKGFMKTKDGISAAEFYRAEKTRFANLRMGMVFGINYLNHGDSLCWDYRNTGSSSGRLRGDNQGTFGGVSCSTDIGNEINWVASPRFLGEVMTAALNDPDAPFVSIWSHATPGTGWEDFKLYETRSDYVQAFRSMINRGKQRTTWRGWRAAK